MRPFTGGGVGLSALYDHVQNENKIFRDRITFLFPTSPSTKHAKNVLNSALECAECAEALRAIIAPTRAPVTNLTDDELNTIKQARSLLRNFNNHVHRA
jgi:hypothetical protein